MNFTVANHNSAKNPKGFIHYDSVEFSDIPQMVTSGYAYCACKLKDNYRADSNFDGCVDTLIIDVDDSCTIKQAKILFKKYEFFLVTSRNHQKDKHGLVCDRFRLFFNLDKTIHIRQHIEEVYRQFINKYPFVDEKTRNVSRFFFSSSSDAIVLYNKGAKYKTIIPNSVNPMGVESTNDTKEVSLVKYRGIYALSELSGLWVNEYGEVLVDEDNQTNTIENQLKGGEVYLEDNFYKSNRNQSIYNCACMLLRDGIDEQTVVEFLTEQNDKRDSLKFNEVMRCVRSALRTI